VADNPLFAVSAWVLPVLIAITFHEAAHGFVAMRFGDDTARRAGRVTFNPFRHIDPFGTVLLPALLIALRAPFLFGYAKPVPVDARRLRNPRRDMIWVALAGPGINVVLAIASAILMHAALAVPGQTGDWLTHMLGNSILLNALLAIFNMLPFPPLDGGRVLLGVLPPGMAASLRRIEPYGLVLLIGLFIVVPFVSQRLGLPFSPFHAIIAPAVDFLITWVTWLAGLR
jgi:Zn-dependent protease